MRVESVAARRPQVARHARVVWDPARERSVLLAPEGVLVLNGTGAAILGLCDGQRTVAAIGAELRGTYDRVVEEEVSAFLEKLAARRLVELNNA